MISILIVDDHPIVRQGLRETLEKTGSFSVSEASNGLESIKLVRENNYDLIILDISMPGLNGLDTLKQLHSEKPELLFLVISMHPEEQYALRAIRAGARGYITKSCLVDEVVKAIRRVLDGKYYINAEFTDNIIAELQKKKKKKHLDLLSDREQQILSLIADGKKVQEISKELCISPKTVSTYRARLMTKLNINNSAELVSFAVRNKIV